MRRPIAIAAAASTLAVSFLVGPMGVAAGAPYVYGCTPASTYSATLSSATRLWLYNGTAATA